MSEEDGVVSSCSICAVMSDLVGKLTFSSKLLRFVSCFGELSLFEPLLAFLFFSPCWFNHIDLFSSWKNLPRRGAQQSTSIHSDRSTQSLSSNIEAVLHSVWEFWHYILRQTEWIQLLARFVGWILSRFLINVVFGVVTVAALAVFCYLGSERLPALSTICLFGCLTCVWRFVCRLSFV